MCTLRDAVIYMLSPRATVAQDPQRRLAIIFDRYYRRLTFPGSRHLLPYLLRGEWRRWWRPRRRCVHYSGRVAVLSNYVSDRTNYYHFWADNIADIWYLRQLLAESEMPERYLMPFSDLPWQRRILEMCGIGVDQVIPFTVHEWLSVDTLIVPVRDKGATLSPPWLAHAIRDMADWKNDGHKSPASRRLFLSRADAPRRRVVDEERLHDRLRTAGFEILTLDGLDVREQQALFASASVILAPHGAALTNLVWCRPGAAVVDFLSENHLLACFRELAWQTGVDYHPIPCRQVGGDAEGIEGDIEITLEQLDGALKRLSEKDIGRVCM
ncbi:glycosyltransferase family 61 protein [Modicisalibacter ilicicola]|uniref:glycosyltransferase family 61 protein n=1 Tax=Modicisalibacter ilicicola TaxID=480814 RepID=UPI001587CC0D|nr:glycosyltransferase family 61 protein [Halomonas ilicicola]